MTPNNHNNQTQPVAGPSDPDLSVTQPPEERRWMIAGVGLGYRIATFTVFLIAFIVFLVYALSRITHVLELFIIGLLIAMAISPMVLWLEKRRVSRMVSVGALLVVLAGGIGGGMATLLPTLVDQSTRFVQQAPAIGRRLQQQLVWLDRRFPDLHVAQMTDRLQAEASQSLSTLQGTATAIFTTSVTTVFETLLVAFIVVFLLTDPHPLVRGLRGMMPPEWQPEVGRIGELVVGKVEAWIQGSLILMLSIAVADTIGLMIIGVPYALLWGVLSGLLEIIPTVGPIIAAIPPVLVALTISPITALWVLGMYTVIQQIEGNILVPIIMSNKVQLHPITLLFFLLMMTEFLGVFGALVATPLAAVVKVLYMELYYRRLHGSLPPEEANDPIRQKRKRRLARQAVEQPPESQG